MTKAATIAKIAMMGPGNMKKKNSGTGRQSHATFATLAPTYGCTGLMNRLSPVANVYLVVPSGKTYVCEPSGFCRKMLPSPRM